MSEIKWIKLFTHTYDDEKIKIIDSMLDKRDVTHYVWIRLLIQAAKTNSGGRIFLDENTPFTYEFLAILFNRPIAAIEDSLKILANLRLIAIDESGIMFITNWNKYQNVEGMEKVREQTRKRVNKYRVKNKDMINEVNDEIHQDGRILECVSNIDNNASSNKEISQNNTGTKSCNVTVTKENKSKIEKENKKKNEIENENKLIQGELSESNIIEYIKGLKVKIRGSNLTLIKAAVLTHGGKNVKLAIDKALEVDRPRMNYINGILNNWKIEGYPESSLNSLENNCAYKNSKARKNLNFNNFEPRVYDYEKLEKELLGWERD